MGRAGELFLARPGSAECHKYFPLFRNGPGRAAEGEREGGCMEQHLDFISGHREKYEEEDLTRSPFGEAPGFTELRQPMTSSMRGRDGIRTAV